MKILSRVLGWTGLVWALWGSAFTWGADVRLSPQAARIAAGQRVAVEVRIADAERLRGYQLDVGYKGGLARLVDAREGGFLKSDGASTFFVPPAAADQQQKSKATVAATRVGKDQGVSGSGTLAVLTFEGTPKAGKGKPVKSLNLSVVPGSIILVQE